jgi:acetolactate synthase regulatory subunit
MAFPGTYNFNYYRGDTFEFKIFPKLQDGTKFDLTNYTAKFTVANRRGTGATQITMTAPTVNASEGLITCVISSTNGRNLTAGVSWVYDVEIVRTVGNANTTTLLTGGITVTEDVTQ